MNSWLWNFPSRSEWPRLLLECVVIITLGIIVGFSVNVELLRGVLGGEVEPQAVVHQAAEAMPVPAMLEEVRELFASGALAVDARLPEQFAEGHLPAAYNLPLAEYEAGIDAFVQGVPVDRVLVLYCNGYGCPDSFDLGMLLMERGYKEVLVFEGGYPEWQAAGLPVEGGRP